MNEFKALQHRITSVKQEHLTPGKDPELPDFLKSAPVESFEQITHSEHQKSETP